MDMDCLYFIARPTCYADYLLLLLYKSGIVVLVVVLVHDKRQWYFTKYRIF